MNDQFTAFGSYIWKGNEIDFETSTSLGAFLSENSKLSSLDYDHHQHPQTSTWMAEFESISYSFGTYRLWIESFRYSTIAPNQRVPFALILHPSISCHQRHLLSMDDWFLCEGGGSNHHRCHHDYIVRLILFTISFAAAAAACLESSRNWLVG